MKVSASKVAEIQDLRKQQRESPAKGMGCLESKADAAQVRACVPPLLRALSRRRSANGARAQAQRT